MVISKQEYERLKEYYDFQRKKQYNREQLMYVCGHIMGIDQDDAGDNDFFDEMWSKFEEKITRIHQVYGYLEIKSGE